MARAIHFCIFVLFNSSRSSRVCSENVILVRLGDLQWVLEIHHFKFFLFFSILLSSIPKFGSVDSWKLAV